MQSCVRFVVAAGPSLKAVQIHFPTGPKEDVAVDTADPAAHVELGESARTDFAWLAYTMMAICSIHPRTFRSCLNCMN